MDGHRTAERRSLAYHREVAERLLRDNALLGAARARVSDWARDRTVHERYRVAWAALLSFEPRIVADRLVEDSEEMRALRQVSPFAGVLEPRVRWQIWRSVA